jgi:hypothetical protein
VSLSIVARYLFGNAGAIREVATNRAALWTGIWLVVLTGIARNYDQNYALETPMWWIGPLVFSFFSGSFLYWIVVLGFARRHLEPTADPQQSQWPTFMALFWMTAPIAWLYAIPVERTFDSYRAAQANLILLAIVSLWRVLLISRVLSVLLEVRFGRVLSWVLVGASLEVIIVVFLGGIFSPSFGRRVMAGMAGMRNAPEENLLSSALTLVWVCSWALLFLVLLLIAVVRFRGTARRLPAAAPGRIPVVSLLVLTLVWVILAVPAQLEQYRFFVHSHLVSRERYEQALAYVGQYQKSDFPSGRRLEPNPYEYRVWRDLPPTVALLTTNTPAWVRDVYLSHAAITFTHHRGQYQSLADVARMFSALEQLPEGRDWLLTNQVVLGRQRLRHRHLLTEGPNSSGAVTLTNIVITVRRMGMAETNVAGFVE